MEIKIIGSNSSNGLKLRKIVTRASNAYSGRVIIELLDDMKEMKKYKIKNVPGLVINGKVVSEGYVPSVREIEHLLESL